MTAVRNHTFIYEGQQTKVTVSMGGAFFPEDANDKVTLIKKADTALYRAKDAGRNRFECCFDFSAEVHDLSKAVSSN
jgi:diguanylate cyclase (GGDEF)-like protein